MFHKYNILLLLILCLSIQGLTQTDFRPNIIYIMTDDLGYADLSGYGRKDYNTPHLDHLATQGLKFMNAYSAGALCTPTRVGFMTGKDPAKTHIGLFEPLVPTRRDSAFGLSADIPTVPSLLKKAGYETALIGKWHLGFKPEFSPNKNGFDYFFGFKSGGIDYVSHKNGERRDDLFENETPVYITGYMTDIFEQKVTDFLNKEHSKPFFLSIQFNAPHWPWQGPNDPAYPDTMGFRNGGSPKTFAAMMTGLDNSIGRIMKTLERKGLVSNTLVIFTSDNGGERFSDMGGYKKGKFNLWEGGLRVPAFVRWEGQIKPGTLTNVPVITMDWTATILSVAKANSSQLDGIDLTPLFLNIDSTVNRTFYWRLAQRFKQKAVRDGDWKYLQDEKGEYLFNLKEDPFENTDLKKSNPDVFERLKKKYSDWEKTVLTPIPL